MKGKLSPWMFVVGISFWALVGVGIATGKTWLFGVALGLLAIAFGTLLVMKIRRSSAIQARRKQVWGSGTPGSAKVVSIAHDGSGINDDPKIDFELEVTPEGGESYAVSTSAIIEQICIPQVQPECEIRVRIDPDDPTFVVIDERITSPWYLPR